MERFKKQRYIDSFCEKARDERHFDWPLVKFIQKRKKAPLLFSRYGKTRSFSTDNLHIHFIKSDKKADFSSLDGFLSFEKRMPVAYALRHRKNIYARINEQYGDFKNYLADNFKKSFREMSLAKAWNFSLVGALVFGMFLMTSIYKYLGQEASAVSIQTNPGNEAQTEIAGSHIGKVLGEEDLLENNDDSSNNSEDIKEIAEYVSKMMESKELEDRQKLEEEMREMVKGYPIEEMVPYILKQDRVVAAFLIGIAKKESAWGMRVPVLNGEDCHNYWGYRGIRKRMGSGGHTCFDGPEDAVETVAKRLKFLVSNEKMTTPGKMVTVWKCGYDCSWDDPAAVRKWVSDVDYYFKKFDKFGV